MFKEIFLRGGGGNAAASSTVFLSGKEKPLKIHQNIVPGEAVAYSGIFAKDQCRFEGIRSNQRVILKETSTS